MSFKAAFKENPWGITVGLLFTLFLIIWWFKIALSMDWSLVWQFVSHPLNYGMPV
jgi:hypothetical protein